MENLGPKFVVSLKSDQVYVQSAFHGNRLTSMTAIITAAELRGQVRMARINKGCDMDRFETIILNVTVMEDGTFDTSDFVDDDMLDLYDGGGLHIEGYLEAIQDGTIARLLEAQMNRQVAPRESLFMHGEAMFPNFDDAKNSYLMDPEIDIAHDDGDDPVEAHVPFCQITGFWKFENVGVGPVPAITRQLLGAVVILYWQEHNA